MSSKGESSNANKSEQDSNACCCCCLCSLHIDGERIKTRQPIVFSINSNLILTFWLLSNVCDVSFRTILFISFNEEIMKSIYLFLVAFVLLIDYLAFNLLID